MPDAAITVSELVRTATERIAASGVLADPDAPVGADARQAFDAAVARRERGEPVAYIRGFREFHGLAFATDARALIPRPETELLVDAAITEIVNRLTATPRPPGAPRLRVVDVGTGLGTELLGRLREERRLADAAKATEGAPA